MASTLQVLRDIIAIPSVNPMRATNGEYVEKGMANFIEAVLSEARIDCERQTVAEGRDNVIAIVHSTDSDGGGLMLNSHMDTVPVDNTNEFIEVKQVELATRMYRHLLANWNA